MKTAIRNYSTMLTTLFFALGISLVTMANDKTGNEQVASEEPVKR